MNRNRRAIYAAIPVVGVNLVAFFGQLAFLNSHLPWVAPAVFLVAVVIESVAVYLAWQAHLAQLANDSALRLRLGAYGFALLIAVLNYSHYAAMPGWRPTAAAVIVGACSAISPWLWGIYSRRESRDDLMARGLVEAHAVRLGGTRWFWHLYRSLRVMWHATWGGETDPQAAIAAVYPAPGARYSRAISAAPFTDAESAAAEALARSVAGGNPLSQRQLQTRFRLTRGEETRVRDYVVSPNGNGPHE